MSFDLIKSLKRYSDPHLSLLLLEHAEEANVADKKSLTLEKISVLRKTNALGYLEEELQSLPQDQDSNNLKSIQESIFQTNKVISKYDLNS